MGNIVLTPEQVTQALTPQLETLKLFKAKTAAELFSMTPQGFRKLAKKHGYYDVGGMEGKRWSVADLKALQELRRVDVA